MTKLFSIIIILVFSSNIIYSQIAPKYSNEFLNIGVGARSLGMANAVVSSTDDVTSVYWNPANLIKTNKQMQVGLMHAEYFAGIAKFDFAATSYKIDANNTLGAGFIRFAVDNIPNTLELIDNDGNIRWDRLSSFSSSDMAVFLSYARKSKIDGLDMGANVKIIRRKAGNFGGAWGFGLDAALTYDYKNWRFAAIAKDVSSTFNAWSFNHQILEETWNQTGNELPENSIELSLPSITPALSREFVIYGNFSAMAEVNFFTTFDGKRNTLIKTNYLSIDPSLGIEFDYNKLVFLRAGAGGFQEIPYRNQKDEYTFQPAVGAGISLRSLEINYALSNLGNSDNFYSHVFSLIYSFDINEKTESISSF